MNARLKTLLLVGTAFVASTAAQAASVSLTPAVRDVGIGEQTPFTLSIDFTIGTDPNAAPIGGGLIFDFSGPVAFRGFTPSAFFNTLNTAPNDDTDFTGFGTNTKPADAEFEIHFGSFTGITGIQDLGTLSFEGLDMGQAVITMAESPGDFYGGFFDLGGRPVAITLTAPNQITVIPLPATAWLFLAGLGAAATRLRRR
jgi:hypothetical protein